MDRFNHKTIFSKLTKLFFIFGLFLIVIATLVMYYLQQQIEESEIEQKSQLVLKYKQHAYVEYIQEAKKLLKSIQNSTFLKRYLKNHNNKNDVEELFYTLAQANSTILQIRYLNEQGQEQIRINKDAAQNRITKVPIHLLQQKDHRYYVDEIKRLKEDETYLSKLDLNIENEQIEVPYVPTLRLANAVYKNNKIVGMIIINLQMKEILDSTVSSDIFNIYLVDEKNNVVYSNDESKNNWSNTLNVYSRINTEEIINKEMLFQSNQHKLYIALKQKDFGNKAIINNTIVVIVLILVSASLFFVYLLRTRVNFILEKFNDQNKYVIQQVKLESIGKLLENLAHQWRQPLNVISSLSSSSKMMMQMDLLKTNELYNNLDQITATCIGLSHTIDDFKNFFKIDSSITSFQLLELKQEALEKLEELLDKNGIAFITDKKSINLKMKGSKNALVQVLMVLIKNSIEAHMSNPSKERYIFFLAQATKENITITIKDNAQGIPSDIMDKIFEPYFTTKHQSQGKGMGLYIVHQVITQQLNGQIEVHNVQYRYNHQLQIGTEFCITLPIQIS
ncbi:ATP-binding protein [Candidatus Marinarcus aquaticus]|uniref:histidine kinase n=1 Tax=Candidatus Marinarcus aquaticus TaxID=2044504 RepID=A0A4Q0XTN6_9BACT|nr:ATP-binding protein [Candidatus Marinarcus aquaticus]RXJ57513.1 hypothetical protein CRV04_06800 [Candidatus Marinarcus aquaticus]